MRKSVQEVSVCPKDIPKSVASPRRCVKILNLHRKAFATATGAARIGVIEVKPFAI